MTAKPDTFLVDAIKKPKSTASAHHTYMDGLRFGFGFFTAGLIMTLILGLLTWGVMYLMQTR